MSGDKVLTLVQPETPDEIVPVMTRLLERAKAGEFSGVTVIAMKHDRSFVVVTQPSHNLLEMIGALTVAQRDYIVDYLRDKESG